MRVYLYCGTRFHNFKLLYSSRARESLKLLHLIEMQSVLSQESDCLHEIWGKEETLHHGVTAVELKTDQVNTILRVSGFQT